MTNKITRHSSTKSNYNSDMVAIFDNVTKFDSSTILVI
jgi:hypothetical protein